MLSYNIILFLSVCSSLFLIFYLLHPISLYLSLINHELHLFNKLIAAKVVYYSKLFKGQGCGSEYGIDPNPTIKTLP